MKAITIYLYWYDDDGKLIARVSETVRTSDVASAIYQVKSMYTPTFGEPDQVTFESHDILRLAV